MSDLQIMLYEEAFLLLVEWLNVNLYVPNHPFYCRGREKNDNGGNDGEKKRSSTKVKRDEDGYS
ncbi:hypothetical protein HK098_008274, partial [Nowakowskiella sp. JEL0407]